MVNRVFIWNTDLLSNVKSVLMLSRLLVVEQSVCLLNVHFTFTLLGMGGIKAQKAKFPFNAFWVRG